MKLEQIKEALQSDEKALVTAFGLERFFQKHKKTLVFLVVAGLLAFVGFVLYGVYEESKLQKANQAWESLRQNPNDQQALQMLQENNPTLYEVYVFAKSAKEKDLKTLKSLTKSSHPIVQDSARYHSAVAERKSTNSTLYEELAQLQEAYIALRSGDKKKASLLLEGIDKDSAVSSIASILRHATIKGGE